MKNNFEIYKKMIIRWEEGGLNYKHYKEKMVITTSQVSFERKVDCHMEFNEVFDTVKWSIKTNDIDFNFYFHDLCSKFFDEADVSSKILGSDTNMFSIEIILDDNTKHKEEFHGNMLDNGLKKVYKLLNDIVPKAFNKPYFLK